MNGWIEGEIAESVRLGRCPVCDAIGAGYQNYLGWLRTNLNDEKFRRSVVESGGYCVPHLQEVIAALQVNPYNGLSLLKVMRAVLMPGGSAERSSGCHLCQSLKQTEKAYFVVMDSNSVTRQGGRPARILLCPSHSAGATTVSGRGAPGQPVRKPDARSIDEFLSKTGILVNEFHRKDPETLRREVERCEALLMRAVVSRDEEPGR